MKERINWIDWAKALAVASVLFDIKEGICYQWYEALPVTLVIVALLYPIILFAKKHCPVLIGRNRVQISK